MAGAPLPRHARLDITLRGVTSPIHRATLHRSPERAVADSSARPAIPLPHIRNAHLELGKERVGVGGVWPRKWTGLRQCSEGEHSEGE